MTIGEFFGTLQDSITAEWRKHLEADNHDVHVILDEFYKEMPEKVDALIEAWQADNEVVNDYSNILDASQMSALDFLEQLKTFVKQGREELLKGESELESLCDDILSQIDSTIYKLKRLTKNESRMVSLVDFIKENLNESYKLDDMDEVAKVFADFRKKNSNGTLKTMFGSFISCLYALVDANDKKELKNIQRALENA